MHTSVVGGAVVVVTGVLLSGCAVVRTDQDFAALRTAVSQRTGAQPKWYALSPEDAQVQNRTREVLSGELTVESAVELALLNNRRLQAGYEDLGVARADLVQAGLLMNPVLSADATFGLNASGYGVAVGLVQNFMRAFQIPLRRRVAAAALQEATFSVASQVIDLVVDVKRAFVKAQADSQLVEVDRNRGASMKVRQVPREFSVPRL